MNTRTTDRAEALSIEKNIPARLAAAVEEYADDVSARWELDHLAARALCDVVAEAVAGWSVADIDQPSDRTFEAADTAAPIYYSEQARLLTDPLSLGMVNRGISDLGVPEFDPSRADFYQWTCTTAAAGWQCTLSSAMSDAVCGLVAVDGLRALGLSEAAAEVAATLVRDGSWTGNLAGLHLTAELLGGAR